MSYIIYYKFVNINPKYSVLNLFPLAIEYNDDDISCKLYHPVERKWKSVNESKHIDDCCINPGWLRITKEQYEVELLYV